MNKLKKEHLCRICLKNDVDLYYMYDLMISHDVGIRLVDFLAQITNIQYDNSDGYPSEICTNCVESLTSFYALIQTCIKSHEFLTEQRNELGNKAEGIENAGIDSENIADSNVNDEITNEECYKQDHEYLKNDAITNEECYIRKYFRKRTDARNGIYKCAICSEELSSKKNLRVHVKGHINEELTRVNTCPKENIADSNVNGEKTNEECCTRDQGYIENNEITNKECCKQQDHEILENGTNVRTETYKCAICSEEVACKDLGVHVNDHVNEKIVLVNTCPVCSEEFLSSKTFNAHRRRCRSADAKNFQCDVCGLVFVYEYLLKRHGYKHSEAKPFPCPDCNKGCITKASLRRHRKIHDINYIPKQHSCDVCNKQFRYASNLAEHMKIHTGERPFLCNLCGKGFRQSGSLGYHMRSHTGEKLYKCEVCDNSFTTSGTLRVHMRTHTNERPYVCDICGMAFKQSTDMKSHREKHSGIKKHLCFICGKTFRSTGQLTYHIRTHTGEKPFECQVCAKSFTTRTTLVKHVRIHTGEKPYSCEICGKSFNQGSTLKTHYKTHKRSAKLKKDELVEEASDGNCIVMDENIGAHYSIETVGSLDLGKTKVNVVVLPIRDSVENSESM